jgi:putative flippase GtrA
MRSVHNFIRSTILQIIDWFYPWFKKIMPKQTFRYAACGGFNTLTDITLFFVAYNFIFHKKPIQTPVILISAPIASFLFSFLVTFPVGFYLSRYVVFQQTEAKKTVQLRKYFMVVMGCLFLNYIFLKLFIEVFHWYPTPSKIVTTFFVIIFSYLSQKHYTFKAVSSVD